MYSKINAFNDLKEYKKAIDCIDKLLQIDPKNIYAFINKGLAYYNLKEYKKAINCYDQVLIIDPKNIDTFNYKGLAYND